MQQENKQEEHSNKDMKHEIAAKIRRRQNIKTLIKWTAPERIWKPKTQTWYLLSALVILLVIFVFVRLQAYVPILAMIAFMVVWFIQGYMQPSELTHKITNRGIYAHGTLHDWNDITYFWMARKQDQLLLHVDFPKDVSKQRLTMLVPDSIEFELFNTLIEYIKYGAPNEVEYTFVSPYIYGQYVPVSRFIPDLDQPEEDDVL